MKKIIITIGFIACLMLSFTLPASANNSTMGQDARSSINRGMNDTNRALGTNSNSDNSYNANNYRANATNDDGFDWGWLGLLGLLGLAGMKSRDRERDRA